MTSNLISKTGFIIRAVSKKSMIVLMTGVLLFKAPAHDNHKLLSYDMIIDNGLSYHIIDNGFCNMIITLSILLHITTQQSIQPLLIIYHDNNYAIPVLMSSWLPVHGKVWSLIG